MIAYYPKPDFPPVSISPCKLMCKHCMGKYLKGMKKIYQPEKLLLLGNKKLNGILISGGFNKKGEIENLRKMIPAMRELRKKFCIAIHPGFIDEKTADLLMDSVDIAFVDIPSNSGIKNVYGLDEHMERYIQNMEYFIDRKVMVSPHITVGLNFGKIEEWEILDIIRKYNVVKMVIDVIIPTRGTPFEGVKVDIEELHDFFREAKKKLKRIALGCMRPRPGIDKIAYESGIHEIAVPSPGLVKKIKEKGEEVVRKNICCGCP